MAYIGRVLLLVAIVLMPILQELLVARAVNFVILQLLLVI